VLAPQPTGEFHRLQVQRCMAISPKGVLILDPTATTNGLIAYERIVHPSSRLPHGLDRTFSHAYTKGTNETRSMQQQAEARPARIQAFPRSRRMSYMPILVLDLSAYWCLRSSEVDKRPIAAVESGRNG
jgi:hypothetical protein